MYAVYISDWFKIFPREQFFFITLTEYADDDKRRTILENLFEFLELRKYCQVSLSINSPNWREPLHATVGYPKHGYQGRTHWSVAKFVITNVRVSACLGPCTIHSYGFPIDQGKLIMYICGVVARYF
jgi:hypothetical protein